jgi:hypothetical protein
MMELIRRKSSKIAPIRLGYLKWTGFYDENLAANKRSLHKKEPFSQISFNVGFDGFKKHLCFSFKTIVFPHQNTSAFWGNA